MCAVVLVAVMACAISCRYGLSVLIARDRPPQADWAYHAWGYAFPSGHAFDAALAAGLTGLLLGRRLDLHPVARAAGWAAVIVYAVAVAATRLYLGVHWPSGILGSWVFARYGLLLPPGSQVRPVDQGRSIQATAHTVSTPTPDGLKSNDPDADTVDANCKVLSS
jgi:membrane-associated phospholipid phosphatase